MGVVHAAEHTMSGQEVALKRISRAVADQHELANRVFRETRTLARLRHSNIVQLLDCGIAASSGVYYLVMELVVGDSMRALIARAKKKRPARGLPLRLALHVMAQVAEAMVCAHELHIVHRDLKPENVMVKPGGHALVLDFGLAKNLGQARITNLPPDGVKSNPASVLGTPRYMAPEQVRGLDVDERADVYAMGIVLFESIAGCSPYQMADDTVPPTDIMCFHVFAIPTQLRELVPEAPPAVASLIARCLSKDPAARPSAYQMAVELRGQLAALGRAALVEEAAPKAALPDAPWEARPTEPMPATFTPGAALPFGPPEPAEVADAVVVEVEMQPQRATVVMLPGYPVASPTFAGSTAAPEPDTDTELTLPKGKAPAAPQRAEVKAAPVPHVAPSGGLALALPDTALAVVPDGTPEGSSLGRRPKMRTPPYLFAPLGGLVMAVVIAAGVKMRAPLAGAPAPRPADTTLQPASVGSVGSVVPTAEPTTTAAASASVSDPAPALPVATAAPPSAEVAPPMAKVTAPPAARARKQPPSLAAPAASPSLPQPAPAPAPTAAAHRLFGAEQ